MINYIKTKKKLIVSYKNLSDDLKALFKETYPDGYQEYLQRAYKPNGEPLFVVPMETDDTSYMIKFDVKVDTLKAEDLEKEMFDTDTEARGGDDDYTMDEVIDKEDGMGDSHTERVINHGNYDGMLDEVVPSGKKKKGVPDMEALRNELAAEFDTDDDDDDEYKDNFSEDDLDDEDDFEPTDEDLAEIEGSMMEEAATSKKGGKKTAKPAAKKTSKKEAPAKKEAAKKPAAAKASTAKKSVKKK